MNTSMDFDALNIAPQAPRHRPLAWVMLFVSVGVFCASLFPLSTRLHELDTLKERRLELQRMSAALADKLRREKASGDTLAAREREKTNREFQAMVRMSWDGVFDSLEAAALSVHGGTSIVSMIPKNVAPDAIDIDLTALAANLPIMLAYLEALKTDPRVRAVELTTQQPDNKTSPDAIRFQIVVSMDPARIVPHPQRSPELPRASTGAQGALRALPSAVSSGAHNK